MNETEIEVDAIRSNSPRWLFLLACLFAVAALGDAIYILLYRLDAPLLDAFSFRQTQTALSSYWLIHGSPFFAYQTPVVGSPWAIPFEFPFYQELAALLSLTGIPLDASGRLVSFLFFVLAFFPLKMLWADLKLPRLGLPITFGLLLMCPEYAFYSRTFLMESCAWFFGFLWLALFVRFLTFGRTAYFFATLVAGCLAVLVKSTTFPAFAVLGGLFFLGHAFTWFRDGASKTGLPRLIWAIVLLILPFFVGSAWVVFSDAVKSRNMIGQGLTAKALAKWNFGTLAQRESSALWQTVLQGRVLPDIFGTAWGIALLVLAGTRLRMREISAILALVIAFLTPFLVFTNLHMVHGYYQYANDAFLICAVGIALGSLGERGRSPLLAAAAVVVLVVSQIVHFQTFGMPWLNWVSPSSPDYAVALAARSEIPKGQSLLVIGDDWTSVVPYYSQRKSLAIPGWVPEAKVSEMLTNPAPFVVGTQLGGVVICTPTRLSPHNADLLSALTANGQTVATNGNCSLIKLK